MQVNHGILVGGSRDGDIKTTNSQVIEFLIHPDMKELKLNTSSSEVPQTTLSKEQYWFFPFARKDNINYGAFVVDGMGIDNVLTSLFHSYRELKTKKEKYHGR